MFDWLSSWSLHRGSKEKQEVGKMVLTDDVEAVSAGIKPDDSMRISTGGKCDFSASAPLLTRASPMHFS